MTSIHRFTIRCHAATVALLTAVAATAQSLAAPTAPVRIVIGLPAGTAPDVVARTLAEAMAPLLGQQVIVENRPGAGGTLATSAVAAAPPDGHTLNASGCSADAITHAFVSQGRPPLTLFKDLTPVGRLMRDHWLVLVPTSGGPSTLQELGSRARAQLQPLAFPSQGEGSTPHLQSERLARTMGFKALHVPYKDSAMNDLVGGRLAYAVMGSAGAMPLLQGGRLRALAVLSTERLAALPDVPTASEAGLPGYVFNGGVCLWAPGATPQAAMNRLNRALTDAAGDASVRVRFASLGVDPAPSSLSETMRYVADFVAEGDRLRTEVLGRGR